MSKANGRSRGGGASAPPLRTALRQRLEARRQEIEAAVLSRVAAIGGRGRTGDAAYAQGLRASVACAIDYAFEAIGRGEQRTAPPPPALLLQARMAARSGVGVDTVMHRYLAGYSIIGDYLTRELDAGVLGSKIAIAPLLRDHAALLDRLLGAISEEYVREGQRRPDSSGKRRTERVRRLLAGELVDTTELGYEFDAWHLGMLLVGPFVGRAMQALFSHLDGRLLIAESDNGAVWAWWGGRTRPDPAEIGRQAADRPAHSSIAIGEAAHGLAGWRLTHRQAAAALPIAERRPGQVVRYGDVALLASALHDDLLATSLRQLYLNPLADARDGGAAARLTLRAYFAAARNVSSAAAALAVSRQTVSSRLKGVESCLGRSLDSCARELETALQLREIAVEANPGL